MTQTIVPRAAPALQPGAPTWKRPIRGTLSAPILVVCDPQSPDAYREQSALDRATMKWFAFRAQSFGFESGDLCFVALAPPIPELAQDSASRRWKHVEAHVPELAQLIEGANPRLVVAFGELASRACLGRAVAITKARGVTVMPEGRGGVRAPVMPFLSPSFVRRIPDHEPTFQADLCTLARLKEARYNLSALAPPNVDYRWVSDLTDFMASKPKALYYDTETTGLLWWKDDVRVLTVQFCDRPGHAVAAPIHPTYFRRVFPDLPIEVCYRLREQVKSVLEDPTVRKMGHNIKYDHQLSTKEDIEVRGWMHDTQLMAFFADENMMSKALDDCVRVWVPEMSGYSDEFDATVDKSRMIDVPPERMLPYACGDVDGGFRLAKALDAIIKRDPKQHRCYRKIQFPALLAFAKVIERWGILIDQDKLRSFSADVASFMREEYRRLVRLIPAQARREMLAADGEVSFKDANMRKILFSKSGFNLKPVVFTKSTQRLAPSERVPSVSIKDHLPYFKHLDGAAGQFVNGIIEYQKAAKLQSTYTGSEDDGTGFWQYIASNGFIYPSYKLHSTVTGRSASENPNGQNFPKRGRFAKPYLGCFVARPGYKLVSADLSQIELRIAAWMASEPTMLGIYRADGDIHTATAQATMGVTEEQWRALPKAEKKLNRTKAKAVNFGFLYGMGAKKFKDYAKTQYDVEYTDAEAELARTRFFAKYARLEGWHKAMRTFVQNNGYVRALHGAVRHLPGINSTDKAIRGEAERQAINSPVQRLGSDLGLLALWRFSFQAPPDTMHLIGFVHDALVMEVRDGYEVEAASALLYAMEQPPLEEYFGIQAPLPIKAEADIGLNQGDMYEFAELPDVLPEWLAAMNLPIVERDGKRVVDVHAERPSWWNDDWREVERQFLYERVTV
jgi:DNA polymerase I-like protein with 3'-5' exonuclease and polymerase domains